MDVAAANTRAARAFVRALAAAGVADACITPGSRSTPLTIAFAEQDAIKPWLHLDERASSYFALGLARTSGRPVALLCTSGTAAANFHPAIAEASLSRIPLIVCTADRPPALRDAGSPQTIPQPGMFGPNVRWAADLPLPSGDTAVAARFAAFATRAVHVSLGDLPGPVHLNMPFDEPLVAAPGEHPPPAPGVIEVGEPVRAQPAPATAELELAANVLAHARRPLIVAGPETGGLPASEVAALAAALDAPVLADPLSGLRTGAHDRSRILDSYDAVLRDPRSGAIAPDCILRFGAIPTSKATGQFLVRHRSSAHIQADLPGSWRDPDALTTHRLSGSPALTAAALRAMLPPGSGSEPGWAAGWLARDRAAREAMRSACASFEEPFEGRVFLELQAALPAGATIVAGNSMPVRDLDSFLFSDAKQLRLLSNRGANGIDGVTSSALGTAAAARGPVVLVIGDLSFYHDLTGLWAAKRHGLSLTIVLVNNDGGGIFGYLPQASHPDVFEEWFGTPSGLDFSHAVALFGGRHTLVRDWAGFRSALTGGGLNVIELRTGRQRNVALHREAWAAAASAAWAPAPAPAST